MTAQKSRQRNSLIEQTRPGARRFFAIFPHCQQVRIFSHIIANRCVHPASFWSVALEYGCTSVTNFCSSLYWQTETFGRIRACENTEAVAATFKIVQSFYRNKQVLKFFNHRYCKLRFPDIVIRWLPQGVLDHILHRGRLHIWQDGDELWAPHKLSNHRFEHTGVEPA